MSDKPNVNPSPRTRFQSAVGNITAHRSLIELPAFDRGADAAMMEYMNLVTEQNRDGNAAMAAGFKLQGAKEFLMVLKTIGESTPLVATRKDLDNLPDASKLNRQ